jgi:hypothetical protein
MSGPSLSLKFECIQVSVVNFIPSTGGLPKLKKIGEKYWTSGFEVKNNFDYCNFPIFELKFRESKVLRKPSRIELKYLEILERYETWSKTFLLHLVSFTIISR